MKNDKKRKFLSIFQDLSFVVFFGLFFSLAIFGYTPQFADEAKNTKLRWKNNKIKIAISNSFLKAQNLKNGEDLTEIVRRALSVWEKVADIELIEYYTDKQNGNIIGKNGDGVNLITIAPTSENLLLFSDDSEEVSAKTRVFYNSKGHLIEADIVFNPYLQFSTDGTWGTFDFESVLVHEIGHLLGLDHSDLIGSTMQATQNKNGVFNLPAYHARTLADDDIIGIRALYGIQAPEARCCGTINGKLNFGKNRNVSQVFLEDALGRLNTAVSLKKDGSFKIEGLSTGRYQLWAKDAKNNVSVIYLGEVLAEAGETVNFSKSPIFKPKNFSVNYLGFNGQLSNQSIILNRGKSFLVFIGGQNLDPKEIEIKFSSPFLKTSPNTLTKHDFGEQISALSFELLIDENTPNGEYGIIISNKKGENDFLIGGFSVDNFLNPWNFKVTQF